MDVLEVFATCDPCGNTESVIVDLETWQSWINGRTDVQSMFPDMTPAEREVLIGAKRFFHICNVCWPDLEREEN